MKTNRMGGIRKGRAGDAGSQGNETDKNSEKVSPGGSAR
jgi:hypothetical protein